MTQLHASRWATVAACFHSHFVAAWRKRSLGLLAVVLMSPMPVLADAPSGNSVPVEKSARGLADSSVALHNGSFTSEIEFQLPSFRKNTPKLSLVYSSAGGNGFAGVGWNVEGFSVIERTSPGRGSPRYGVAEAADGFLLDGEELVPSTALGGTYATKRQRFLRITRSGANWVVYRTDGTVSTYEPKFTVQGKTFRWLLARVTGPGGRDPVTYAWDCPPTAIYNGKVQDCYPLQITYANVVVNLTSEARTDEETFTTGYLLGKTSKRLRMVEVRVNNTRLRSYNLTYGTANQPYSARTGRSLLTKVQQYGKDGATALPATTFDWSDTASGFANAAQLSDNYGISLDQWQNSDLYNADFNGDGRTDLLLIYKWPSTNLQTKAYMLLAKAGGGFEYRRDITALYGMGYAHWYEVNRPIIADFNGDGRPDILYSYTDSTGQWKTALLKSAPESVASNDNLFSNLTDVTNQFGMSSTRWDSDALVLDYNGDGCADLLVPDTDTLNWPVKRLLTGDAIATFDQAVDVTGYWGMSRELWSNTALHVGDFNGDGRSDMMLTHSYGCTQGMCNYLYLLTAKPEGSTSVVSAFGFKDLSSTDFGMPLSHWFSAFWHIGDFNGDGRADIFLNRDPGISLPRYLILANGSDGSLDPTGYTSGQAGFQDAIDITSKFGMTDTLWDTAEIVTGDYNGDGHTDIFVRSTYTVSAQDPMLMLYGRTEGFANAIPVTDLYGMSVEKWGKADYRVGDYNGDGVDDLLVHSFRGTNLPMPQLMLYATGLPGNLVTSMANGYGAVTTINYVPSSNWVNTANPPLTQTVKSMAVTDGLGWSKTTQYEFAGGAWDAVERRHLGFRYVKEIDPTGAYRESYFFLGATFQLGEVQDFYERDANGLVLREQHRLMSDATVAAPWVRLPLQLDEWEYNGAQPRKHRFTAFEYDGYGNRTRTIEYGDFDVNGDERNTQVVYRPNATSYLVDYPSEVVVRAGVSVSGTTLQHRRYYYDGQALTSAPTLGDITRDEQWLNTTGAFVGKTYTYDAATGNMLSQTDALGRTTTYEWATTAGLFSTRQTNALSHVRATTWDEVCGTKDIETDENGNVTDTNYDALCRPILQTRPDNGRTEWKYVAFGSTSGQYTLETVYDGVNPVGAFKLSYFDGLGRIYLSHNNAAEIVDTQYDPRGLVLRVSAPHLTGEAQKWTTYTYDALQRLRTRTAPDASVQQILYEGWRTTTCDELGKPRTETRDAYGQIRQVNEYLGQTCVMDPGSVASSSTFITTIAYDLLGRRIGHTDALGNSASSTYDSLGREISRVDPDMGAVSFDYDDAGNMIRKLPASGTSLNYAYDALDRLKTVSYRLDWSTLTLIRNTYDCDNLTVCVNGIGRLQVSNRDESGTSSSKVVHSVAYQYDKGGRKILESRGITSYSFNSKTGAWVPGAGRTYDTRRTWDAAGRLRTLTYPSGEVVTYGYDVVGRIKTMTSSTRGGIVSDATYDARGHVVTRTLGPAGSTFIQTFSYEPNRFWLTGVSAKLGTVVKHNVTFGRNARGEVKTRTNTIEPKDNWTYSYDDLRRLTVATNTNTAALSETFQYDAIGRMTYSSTKGTYNYGTLASNGTPLHAPRQVGTTTFQYGSQGELVSGDGVTLDYDPDSKPNLVNSTTMSYDGEGTRTTIGSIDTVGEVYEKDRSNNATTSYYFFGDVRVAQASATGLVYLHGDQLNSAATITNSSGAVLEKQVLSPYGRRLTAVTTTAIGMAGKRLDSTGLYHMGAREMSPSLGIFVTPDPSDAPNPERPQTLNRYAYANNSPTNLVDPTGYAAEENETTYDKVSFWTHNTLSVLGVVPVLGVIPDAVDLVITAVEVPFGKSSGTDLALAGAGVAATFIPVAGDGAAAAGKVAARVAQRELRQRAAELAAQAARKLAKGCGNCFVAGTLVLTSGGLKAIEDIRPGDMVASRYEESGVSEYKPVVGLSGMQSEPVIAVVLANPEGKRERIEVTANHPFMTESGWKGAGDIDLGEAVKSYDGSKLTLVERTDLHKSVRTFNFEVADSHSYFVGKSGVWVHNSGPCPISGFVMDPNKFKYLFGNVSSGVHNADRSAQLANTMKRLGISDTPGGRGILMEHFEDAANSGAVLKTFKNEHGVFEVRQSFFMGPSGKAAVFETTFQVGSDGSRTFNTVIPKGIPKD